MATPDHPFARDAAAIACVIAAACGGSASPKPAVPTLRPAAMAEDLSIDLATSKLQGAVFAPEGLPAPAMLMVRPSKRTTLDKQRAAWKKVAADPRATLARKATEAQVLATLLFEKLAALAPEAPTRLALFDEARAALATVHEQAKGQADRATLEMAAALAIGAGDAPAATPFLDELLARFPDSAAAGMARAQLAFVHLVAGKDAEAAAVVADQDPAASPELAYVIAWVRFRAGLGSPAADAIGAAAAGWQDATTRPALVRDYLIMSSRGGVGPAEAADALTALVPEGADRTAALLDLPRALDLAGRAADADLAADLVLERLGGALPSEVRLATRRAQTDYARRAGRLGELGARWAAVEAELDRCTTCPADARTALAAELAQRAYEQHTIYVTSGDNRRKAAALDLYRVHAAFGAADAAAVAAHARELDGARVPDDGSQYHEAISAPLMGRLQEVLACYEARLQGDRTLGGALTVRLEVDQQGAVSGVTTEPPRGLAGMAAVAACVEDRARSWPLPSRPRPGVARVSLPFLLGTLPQ